MDISLQTIIDLIQNTLKNIFLINSFKIERMDKRKENTKILFVEEENENKKYEVDMWFKYDARNNEFVIRSFSLTILIKNDYFPAVVTTYTASGLLKFEQSLTETLQNARFKVVEMENL